MGNDTPISALSSKPKLLFTYFKQNFAQVTNPPIDPIREELVMSLVSIIGPRPNLFDLEGALAYEAAGSAPADPHQCGPGEDPRHLRGRRRPFQVAHSRHHLAGRAGRRRVSRTRSTRCARAPKPPCAKASTSSSSPTAAPARRTSRCRRCSPARRCIIISSGRGCAPRSASSWNPASRARCIISAALPATAPRRSIPISPSRRCWRSRTSCRRSSTRRRSSSATSSRSTRASSR